MKVGSKGRGGVECEDATCIEEETRIARPCDRVAAPHQANIRRLIDRFVFAPGRQSAAFAKDI